MVAVRHGDGTVVTDGAGSARIAEAIRAHADRLPEIIDTRDALETKLAALAAERRTDDDLAASTTRSPRWPHDIEAGGRGVEGDERFHGAVTAAAHSLLLARLMDEISDLIKETRLESLSQPGRPRDSLAGHQAIADAIRAGDPDGGGRRDARPRRDGQRRGAAARAPLTDDRLSNSSPSWSPASVPGCSPRPSAWPRCSASRCWSRSGCRRSSPTPPTPSG